MLAVVHVLLASFLLPPHAPQHKQLGPTPSRYTMTASTDVDEGLRAFEEWARSGGGKQPEEKRKPEVKRTEYAALASGRHDRFFDKVATSFEAFGVSEQLQRSLELRGITHPSLAQAAAFAPIARGDHVLLAHAAGMGKTLAALVPMMHRLAQMRAEEGRCREREVRAIFVTPTPELAEQVAALARDLADGSGLSVGLTGGEADADAQRAQLHGGLDLLVGTMGRVVLHLGHGTSSGEPSFDGARVRALAVDEADSLYQSSAGHRMWAWLRARLHASECATTMITQALPPGLEGEVRAELSPGGVLKVLKGSGLHHTRAGVPLTLVDCSTPLWKADEARPSLFDAKLAALATTLQSQPARRTLVIVNTAASCERLARELRALCRARDVAVSDERAPRVLPLHASLAPSRRQSVLEAFTKPPVPGALARAGPPRILVATGRAVRGLDLGHAERPVGHVVLFDFPPDAHSYLARVGCATRGDRPPAQVTAFAVGRQLPFARAMLAHAEQGDAVSLDGATNRNIRQDD